MLKTKLNNQFSVSSIGLGCSSMSHGYGPDERDDSESAQVLLRALDLGITLFDTANVYGPHTNERLLGRTLRQHRDSIKIATKCGLVPRPNGKFSRDARPSHLRKACESSLRRLQIETIDLYQLHRVDPAVPIEETWGTLAELVREGKVKALGASHATLAELELMHSIFPLTAVQYELSVWAKHNAEAILPWCRRNNVGFLAFAPIGRGYLSGRVAPNSLCSRDSRIRDPRFRDDAMRRNEAILEGLRSVSSRHGATLAQVAIAWTLTQGDNVVPIPGTKTRHWLEENVKALNINLTPDDLDCLNNLPSATGKMEWDELRVARSQASTYRSDPRV